MATFAGTSNSASGATQLERWVHHNAGIGGRGSSSYIDSVILRDRDVVTSGGSAGSTSDGVTSPGDALEERIYVLQNWRADVVATTGRTGNLRASSTPDRNYNTAFTYDSTRRGLP